MKKPVLSIMLLFAVEAKAATLYDRVEARLKHDPKLAAALGHPAPEMKQVAWMIGRWDIATTVDVQPGRKAETGQSVVTPALGGVWLEIRDTYPKGNQDITYLGFDPATKRWVSTTVDGVGNAVTTTAPRWANDRLVFTGEAVVVGEKATLRQTVAKTGPRAYIVANEERLSDGTWKLLDTYRYTRR
ncbi:MAG TPA: DUF1579 family protein [Rhizomicrobium sp.]|nr:DUF1579 family protein [Rhizomicrobium sp.]